MKGSRSKVARGAVRELNIIWYAASRAATAGIAVTTPVDTGMAMGTILPLAKRLNMFEAVQQLIKPRRRNIRGYTTLYGNWRPNIPKNSGLGLKIATGNSFRYREMKVGDQRLDYSWRMTSYQHVFHNIGGKRWGTLLFAVDQFTAVIQANVKKLADLLPESLVFDVDVKKTPLTIGGAGISRRISPNLPEHLQVEGASGGRDATPLFSINQAEKLSGKIIEEVVKASRRLHRDE